ncbi:MAG: hypothetical protein D6B28_10665 [Gammaproteobacteria bacterium]|nr:MAG: hypothetical protein D6B28_10665 [Gammaproteobacteria bacterium]
MSQDKQEQTDSEKKMAEQDQPEQEQPGLEKNQPEKKQRQEATEAASEETDTLAENVDPLVENEEDYIESEIPEVVEEIAVESHVTVVKSRFAVFLSVLSLLLIAAGAYGGYYLWQQQQQLEKKQQDIARITESQDFSSSIDAIRTNLNRQAEEFETIGKSVNAKIDGKLNKITKDTAAKIGSEVVRLERELDKERSKRKGLERDIDRLMDIAAKNKLDWALAEVHYLATIANNRLTFNKDMYTAIAALETANEKIRRQQDQRLYPLRQRIVDDINALKAVKLPPLVKVAQMLNSIEMKIRELPIPKPQIGLETGKVESTAPDKQDPTGVEDQGIWGRKMSRAISTFKETMNSYIVINHDQDVVVPMMNPETREYLNQNLELKIQTMRISLANRDQQLFNSNLQIIESWVNRYFDKNDQKVLDTVKMIWELKKIELNPQLPNISATIDLILAEKASIQRAEAIKAQIK